MIVLEIIGLQPTDPINLLQIYSFFTQTRPFLSILGVSPLAVGVESFFEVQNYVSIAIRGCGPLSTHHRI